MQLKNSLKENERLDDLLIDGRKIIQNEKLYTFTSDSIRLAKFIKTKPNFNMVELCSGSGIIGIHLALTNEFSSLQMVEIQEALADMCKRSIKMNDLEDKISVHNEKLQGISKKLGEERFDVVFCNPPFEKNAIKTDNRSVDIAKSEITVTVSEICEEAKKLLKYSGKFYLCFPATRIFELSDALSKNGFAIKNVELTFDKSGKSRLALVEASKGGRQSCNIKLFCTADKL